MSVWMPRVQLDCASMSIEELRAPLAFFHSFSPFRIHFYSQLVFLGSNPLDFLFVHSFPPFAGNDSVT